MSDPTSDRILFEQALRAICLTRDYVGEDLLPPIKGWEWFDTGTALAERLGSDNKWTKEFNTRVIKTHKL